MIAGRIPKKKGKSILNGPSKMVLKRLKAGGIHRQGRKMAVKLLRNQEILNFNKRMKRTLESYAHIPLGERVQRFRHEAKSRKEALSRMPKPRSIEESVKRANIEAEKEFFDSLVKEELGKARQSKH